jgi:predicted DNA-binding transcriptional regulator AlpA
VSLEHSPAKQRHPGSHSPPLTVNDLRCITVPQFAELVGFSHMTAKRLIRAGKGPPVVQLSTKRIGIRLVDALRWQQSRIRT